MVAPGKLATEDMIAPVNPTWLRASEQAANAATGVSGKVLSAELKELELNGFVNRNVNPSNACHSRI